MKQFKLINNISGWLVFLFALIVYTLTIERGPSFWDCGEFVAAAYKLQSVHPPGSPLFLMIGRMFSLLAGDNQANVPVMINFMNGMFSALAVLFIFWSVTQVSRRLLLKKAEDFTMDRMIASIVPGVIAGLSATFADSFWFSAVEGEVYALSICFMCFNVWCSLKWLEADEAGDAQADRWLVLTAFMQGLSIGVHLLSLLAIPITFILYYFRRMKFSWPSFILTVLIAMATPLLIMKLVISGVPSIGAFFDRQFVNSFGMQPWIGFLVWMAILFGGLSFGIYFTRKNKQSVLNRVLLGITVLILGFSCYAMVPIRAAAHPPINMNDPQDPYSLVSYLNREQYGDRPLFYGPQFTATQYDLEDVKQGDARWYYNDSAYVIAGYKQELQWRPGIEVLLPRMGFWQERDKYIDDYRAWVKPDFDVIDRAQDNRVVNTYSYQRLAQAQQQVDQLNSEQAGRYAIREKLDMVDNFAFFKNYQLGFMYMRYLLWNFSGRNSDVQGFIGNDDGRWKTGIGFVDGMLSSFFTGAQSIPDDERTSHEQGNAANNSYYAIPFLLGLFGMYWLYRRDKQWFFVIFLLFFITGALQIFYLNQPPNEPRERDYAFAGSYLTFAMFIGFGVMGIYELLKERAKGMAAPAIAAAIGLVAPVLMGSQGWDDHDRSHRSIAHDMALNYLQSCPQDAILFTQGDNDTYPLWYAQQVEGIRTDVRIVNLSLVGVDWYIEHLRRKSDDGKPIRLSIPQEQLEADNKNIVYFNEDKRFVGKYTELKEVIEFAANPKEIKMIRQEEQNYLPTNKFSIKVDSMKVVNSKMVPPSSYNRIVKEMTWSLDRGGLAKNDLVYYDILANNFWDRPICFAISCSPDAFLGLTKYAQLDGLVYRVVPVENPSGNYMTCPVNTPYFYDFYKKNFLWGNIKDPRCYLDENGTRMILNPRNALTRLAIALAADPTIPDGKKKAVEVLNKMNEEWPLSRVPLNIFSMNVPEAYYAAGDRAQGDKMRDELIKLAKENLAYYRKNQPGISIQSDNIQRNLYIMQEMAQTTSKYFPMDTAASSKIMNDLRTEVTQFQGGR